MLKMMLKKIKALESHKYGFIVTWIRRANRTPFIFALRLTLRRWNIRRHLRKYEALPLPPSAYFGEHQKFSLTTQQIYNAPRQPGVSGYYRLYNEEDFLEDSVLSHLPFLDEIILVHDSKTTDNTPDIAQKLAQKYPDKIKYFFYQPTVIGQFTKEFKILPPTDPRSLVNYTNFALSKTTRHVVGKMDGDHIAIPETVANMKDNIHNMDFMKNTFYTYAGLNLWYCDEVLYVDPTLIVGIGDHGFHQMRREKHYYIKSLDRAGGGFPKKGRQIICAGILYFHLKNMRSDISEYSRRGLTDEIHQQRFSQQLQRVQPYLVDWATFVEQHREHFLRETLTDIRTLPDPNVYLKNLLEKIPSIDTKRLLARLK